MIYHYAILIQPKPGNLVPVDAVQTVLDRAKDWARYAPNIWLIATGLSMDYWFGAVRARLQPEDNVMVLAFDPEKKIGWASHTIIDWFARDKAGRPGD